MWTKGNEEGEWELTETWMGGIAEPSYHIGIPNHAHVSGHDNARLISLAPRMAEALISVSDSVLRWDKEADERKIKDLLGELRQMKHGDK